MTQAIKQSGLEVVSAPNGLNGHAVEDEDEGAGAPSLRLPRRRVGDGAALGGLVVLPARDRARAEHPYRSSS